MSLETMGADFLGLVCAELPILDKLRLASACGELRETLGLFFDAWDAELVRMYADQVLRWCPNRSYAFRPVDAARFDYEWMRCSFWPTTRTPFAPAVALEPIGPGGAGAGAFEYVEMHADVGYRLDPCDDFMEEARPGEASFECLPQPENAGFGDVFTLSGLRRAGLVRGVEWSVHPGVTTTAAGHSYHFALRTSDGRVLYPRDDCVVAADVSTVHPRVTLELMGDARLPVRQEAAMKGSVAKQLVGRVSMRQCRLYIRKRTLPVAGRRARAF
jgi:hypothetical protein